MEVAAHLVGHGEAVESRVIREEPAIVGGDVEPCVPEIDGSEEPPEVFPNGPGVVGVGMLVGSPNRFGGEESAVLAERAKEDAV